MIVGPTFFSSPDGFQCLDGPVWSLKNVPASTIYPALSVAVGGGVAVAVSNSAGTPYVVYSLDRGDTWSTGSVSGFSGFPGGGYAPTYGGGWFFALVNAIQGMRSNDGQSWSAVSIPSTIADNTGYGLGKHFVIGNSNTNGILYSSDGANTWTACTGLPTYSGASTNLSATDNVAMFGGSDFTGAFVLTTTDGVTWTRRSAPWSGLGIRYLANNGIRFVAIGTGYTNSDNGYYSDDDGATWNYMSLVGTGAGTNSWHGVIYNGGIFIAVSGNTTDVSISQDGITWSLSPNPLLTGGATSIAAIDNNYIAQRNTTLNTIRVGRCPG